MKYITQLLNTAIDAGEFQALVDELTDLLWNTATDWPTRGDRLIVFLDAGATRRGRRSDGISESRNRHGSFVAVRLLR